MQQVTVRFSDETIAALDQLAERDHRGDRDEAARALLDDWMDRR